MVVKRITIDLEAYEILSRHKGRGQSFSQIIKQCFGGRKTASDLQRALQTLRLSEETLDAIESEIRARRRSVARSVEL
jgi:predicted CopG family antitoxin